MSSNTSSSSDSEPDNAKKSLLDAAAVSFADLPIKTNGSSVNNSKPSNGNKVKCCDYRQLDVTKEFRDFFAKKLLAYVDAHVKFVDPPSQIRLEKNETYDDTDFPIVSYRFSQESKVKASNTSSHRKSHKRKSQFENDAHIDLNDICVSGEDLLANSAIDNHRHSKTTGSNEDCSSSKDKSFKKIKALRCRRLLQCPLLSPYRLSSTVAQDRSSEIRVRFAPSPTGFLHIGGLRTALFNWLFARAHGGRFILRIEDTDQTRYVKSALDDILRSLSWAGLHPDEGPTIGGDFGPYLQSERRSFYDQYAQKLMEEGAAYPCVCTTQRLDLLRREQRRRGETPKYDARCRDRFNDGPPTDQPYVIRFKLTDGITKLKDLIFGDIDINIFTVEGDPVIMKSDGLPVYHFANVVDDHSMRVSHVIRGQEWLTSTPKHLQLYTALGWEPPKFAHIPLLLDEDGHKISKRRGNLSNYLISNLRESGHFPEAVLPWITSVGSGFVSDTTWFPGIRQEEMIEKFRVSNVSAHSGRIRKETLRTCGLAYFNQMVDTDPRTLAEQVKAYLTHKLAVDIPSAQDQALTDQLSQLKNRVSNLSELEGFLFLWHPPSTTLADCLQLAEAETCSNLLTRALEEVSDAPEKISFLKIHVGVCKRPLAMTLIRFFLTGATEGPPVVEILDLLSVDDVRDRLQRAQRNFTEKLTTSS